MSRQTRINHHTAENRSPDGHDGQSHRNYSAIEVRREQQSIRNRERRSKKYSAKTTVTDEYPQMSQISNKSHENSNNNIRNVSSEQKDSKELFTSSQNE